MGYNQKPSMILFDVGGTLFDDGVFSAFDGLEALRKLASNSEVTDTATMAELWNNYTAEIGSGHKSINGTALDFPLSATLRYIIMKTGLNFNISMYSMEEIFDRFNSTRKVLDGIPELLETAKSLGIRTAVISNNAMSGESLALAVKRWIPTSEMEFFLTSADILLSKPDRNIFDIAVSYAGLNAGSCWYCGDSFTPDIYGAKRAGLTPVLIDTQSHTSMQFRTGTDVGEYIVVNNWNELKKYLQNI